MWGWVALAIVGNTGLTDEERLSRSPVVPLGWFHGSVLPCFHGYEVHCVVLRCHSKFGTVFTLLG